MAHRLELAYNWRTPLTLSSVGLSICVGVLLTTRAEGWPLVLVVLLLLWVGLVGVVWLRTRACLMVDGPLATVRSALRSHQVDARQVVGVRQLRRPHGPSYRLSLQPADGVARSCTVPAGLLRSGERTLFGWLTAWAPGAALDDRSTRRLDELRLRGLVG